MTTTEAITPLDIAADIAERYRTASYTGKEAAQERDAARRMMYDAERRTEEAEHARKRATADAADLLRAIVNKDEQPPAAQQKVAAAMPIPSAMEETSSEPIAETLSLIKNGDKLMTMGDPAGARQFYLKAMTLGDKHATLKIGQTYDPTVYSEMNVQGLKPDPQLALRYYLEARTSGDPEAETAITGLDSWMQR